VWCTNQCMRIVYAFWTAHTMSTGGRTPYLGWSLMCLAYPFTVVWVHIATAYMIELRRCFLFSSSFLSFSWTLKNVKPLQKIKSVLIVKFIIFSPYFFNYIELFSIWSFGFWFLYKICHFILWCYMFNPQYFDF
jgi:hypothetical protein